MLPVDSSRLTAIGFEPYTDSSGKGNLQVQFKDGGTGYYENLPIDIFRQLRDAPSKGSFLHEYVISQGYNWVKTS